MINNPAIRSVTIHAVRHGDKLVNRSITFIGQKIKHRYVFRRKIYKQPDDFIAQYSTPGAAKAAAGEYNAHQLMLKEGHTPLGNTNGVYQQGKTGIDGIYKNATPPPDYIIMEAKWADTPLGNTKSGKQMSDEWLLDNRSKRLTNAGLNRSEKDLIEQAIIDNKIQKILVRSYPDGKVTQQLLGKNAELIGVM